MASYLSGRELAQLAPADEAAFQSPVPTQMITNCEFNPLPQTEQQRKVEGRLKASPTPPDAGSASIAAASCAPAAAWLLRSSP
jgi:hypothetical protein